MKSNIEVNWTQEMSFQANVNGHQIVLDAESAVGGKDRGPRPKPLVLVALGGCTGMDVVSILQKMRVEIKGLSIAVEGELTEEHPKYYHTIKTIYRFKGDNLPLDKLEKAVNMSLEKYCGVTAMLMKAARMKHEIIVEK